MLELIPNLPDGVVGVTAAGEVTSQDYQTVLVPAVEESLATHERVRLLYVLGPAFTGFSGGAMWQDGKVGAEHVTRWERIALVCDQGWLRGAVGLFGHLIPGHTRGFGLAELDEAVAWVSSPSGVDTI